MLITKVSWNADCDRRKIFQIVTINSSLKFFHNILKEILVNIKTDGKIRYTVPQIISKKKSATVYFRVSDVFKNVKVNVYSGENLLLSKKKVKVTPGEMESIKLDSSMLEGVSELYFKLEEVSQ